MAQRIGRFHQIKLLLIFVVLLWLVFFISLLFPIAEYGLKPRDIDGLIGIITAPFFHASLYHLIINTTGLLIFGGIFTLLEGKNSLAIIVFIIIVQGCLTWLFARTGNHIGASGLIFGLYGYLLMVGLFNRKLIYMTISLLILFAYGSMIFGILPSSSRVSFEAHLFGFVAGGIAAKLKGG